MDCRLLQWTAVAQADPLEAFMAEINQTQQSEATAQPAEKKAFLALDEDVDNVADFLEVCSNTSTCSPAGRTPSFASALSPCMCTFND